MAELVQRNKSPDVFDQWIEIMIRDYKLRHQALEARLCLDVDLSLSSDADLFLSSDVDFISLSRRGHGCLSRRCLACGRLSSTVCVGYIYILYNSLD